jgi:hypothetical protein
LTVTLAAAAPVVSTVTVWMFWMVTVSPMTGVWAGLQVAAEDQVPELELVRVAAPRKAGAHRNATAGIKNILNNRRDLVIGPQ